LISAAYDVKQPLDVLPSSRGRGSGRTILVGGDDISDACQQQAPANAQRRCSHSRVGTQKRVDLLPGERPIIFEIGDNFPHEAIREPDRLVLVAEMVVENGERQLLRAISLVGPLEAEPGEPLDLVMLVELFAVSRDEKAVDRTLSLIDRHDHTDTVAC